MLMLLLSLSDFPSSCVVVVVVVEVAVVVVVVLDSEEAGRMVLGDGDGLFAPCITRIPILIICIFRVNFSSGLSAEKYKHVIYFTSYNHNDKF